MSTVRQKIAYNVTFSSVVRIIDTFLALIITALLTRYLGPQGFGDYVIVFTFGYILTVLADLGLYSITVREISRNEAEENKIINNAFTLRMASTAIIFFVGVAAMYFLPYQNHVKVGMILASVGFWSLFSAQILTSVFQKNLRIDKAALAEMAGRIFQLILVLVFIRENLGFLSIIIAFSLSSAVNFFVSCRFAGKFSKLGIAADFSVWKKMIREGWPLAFSAILVMLYFRLNIVILSLMKGGEAVGIFGAGYKILENLIFFPAMFVGLVMPMMSRAAKEDIKRFKEILHKSFNALVIILVPLTMMTVILSDNIIYAIAGEKFSESAKVLNILIFATALIFLGTLWSNAIIALNRQRELVKIYSLGAILNFAANLILIPPLSYIGAAWATLATEFLVTALMAFYLWNKIAYFPRGGRLIKIIFAASLASLVVLAAKKVIILNSPLAALAVLLSFGGAFYFLTLYFIGGVSRDELGLLRRPKSE